MADQLNSFSITGVAASLAAAMGIEAPAQANPTIDQIVNLVKNGIDGGRVDRVFMYNPDAVAMWLYQKYTAWFDGVHRHTQLSVPLRTVMPSVAAAAEDSAAMASGLLSSTPMMASFTSNASIIRRMPSMICGAFSSISRWSAVR